MTAKRIQDGKTITITNDGAAAIAYGDVVDLDSRIVIAAENIAIGESGSASAEGVYEIPAITTDSFDQGETVYWDGEAGKVTNVGEGLTRAGWCVAKKLQASTTARIKID